MTGQGRGLLAFVLVVSAFLASRATSGSGADQHQPRLSADSLEVRLICQDDAALMLQDPHGRAAVCGRDSAGTAIPGCRAFSMLEFYNQMGDDDEFEEADSMGTSISDTRGALSQMGDSSVALKADEPSDTSGIRRFVVLAPEVGEWTIEARVPPSSGYLAADLWLAVRVAGHSGSAHVACAWAELKPGGKVWSKLRVSRDGSVVLVRTVKTGEYVRNSVKKQ